MNLLGSSKELAENKLILLYIIDKINIPVSNLHVTKIILENRFMNYFFLQQFLNELCDNNLLECNVLNDKTYYIITRRGKETLSYFLNLIPPGIKASIDNTISSIKKAIKNETHVTAEYLPESENEYVVSCKIQEDNFTLIDLKVTVGSKHDARAICDSWKKNPQEIYQEIISCLIRKRE
ncbi:MAG: DUF4364 family protein [Clostridia bacterium]|nr:DUF4364 family protein [Clostridia bacterium]